MKGARTKTYKVALEQWYNGSYGLIPFENSLDPIAVFEVQETSMLRVATRIIAHLVGNDTTHTVYRIK